MGVEFTSAFPSGSELPASHSYQQTLPLTSAGDEQEQHKPQHESDPDGP